ncbi:MAG: hypothetical protein JW849_08460 [Phycisphaerae bacterium]|nr:hypothetical protein [Phycisphaerae bacterium]
MSRSAFMYSMRLVCLTMFLPAILGCEPKTAKTQPAPTSVRTLSTPFRGTVWETPFGQGQKIATRHYQIFTTVQDSALLATLPGFMEAAYQNYLDIVQQDIPPNQPMPMYMMASRAEWEALTINRFGHAGPARVVEDGGYTFQGVTVCWAIGRTATFSVASHEGMHQFLYHALKNRLPLWAEEGLATTAEGFILDRGTVRFTPDQNLMRLTDLRTAIIHGHWLDLPTLLTTNTAAVARSGEQAKTVGYYGQLYALMSFLRHDETYGPKWRAMFHAAREGKFQEVLSRGQMQLRGMFYYQLVGRQLFEHYITTDLETFEADFLRYARQLVKLPPRE